MVIILTQDYLEDLYLKQFIKLFMELLKIYFVKNVKKLQKTKKPVVNLKFISHNLKKKLERVANLHYTLYLHQELKCHW